MLAHDNNVAVMKVGRWRINIHAISFIKEYLKDDPDNKQGEYGIVIFFGTDKFADTITLFGQQAVDFISMYDHLVEVI